jgi:drug/metabolite transporter (DMT)-like permease
MIGTTLAILSAAASGLSVVLVGKYSRKSNAFNISLIISCVGMAILWPLAAVLTDFEAVNLEGLALFAVGGVLTPGLVRLFYYGGLKRLGTSVNSSIFSVYPLYSALLAVLLLSEILSLENWVGILCVVLGVVFVEMSSREINGEDKSARKSLIFPILGGLTLGVSNIIRKYALDVYNAPVLGVAIAYTFSLLPYLLILMLSAPTRKELSLKRDFRFFWVAGVGQALVWILSFYALSYEEVSIITPLLAIEPLFVVFFAYLYLRKLEHISPKLAVSTIVIVFGVILVTTKL